MQQPAHDAQIDPGNFYLIIGNTLVNNDQGGVTTVPVAKPIGCLEKSLVEIFNEIMTLRNEVASLQSTLKSNLDFPTLQRAEKLAEDAILISTKDFVPFVDECSYKNVEVAGLALLGELLKIGLGKEMVMRLSKESFEDDQDLTQPFELNMKRIRNLVSKIFLDSDDETETNPELKAFMISLARQSLTARLENLEDYLQKLDTDPGCVDNVKEVLALASNNILIYQETIAKYDNVLAVSCHNISALSLLLFKKIMKQKGTGFIAAKRVYLIYKYSAANEAPVNYVQFFEDLKKSLRPQMQQDIDDELAA